LIQWTLPLLHASGLRYREDPVLFTQNGPISSDASYATDEHPGPQPEMKNLSIHCDLAHASFI